MIKFKNLATNEIKEAYSIEEKSQAFSIKFTENGRAYNYSKNNIEIIADDTSTDMPLYIYSIKKQCWKCGNEIELFTYIMHMDNPKESVVYPWDKHRLLKMQNLWAHMFDPSIEYYGLYVIGDDEILDKKLMNKYPDKIKMQYSKTIDKSYPMNVCPHCGAKQGKFFVYKIINEEIQRMNEIEIVEKL